MNKSTSRRYGVEVGQVRLTATELDLIRDRARDYLLDDAGFDTARAWVNATLGHLVKIGVLKVEGVTVDEPEVSSVANLDRRPKRGY